MTSRDRHLALLALAEFQARKHHLRGLLRGYRDEFIERPRVPVYLDCST